MTPLERAARAVAQNYPCAAGDEYAPDDPVMIAVARAVLQAVRDDPSPTMIEAGDHAEMSLGEVRGLGVYGTERIWPAMIDAALEEG